MHYNERICSELTIKALKVFRQDRFPHAEHARHDRGSRDKDVGIDHDEDFGLVIHCNDIINNSDVIVI